MKLRIEDKILAPNGKMFLFKKWLIENNAKKMFSDRKIKSIYFDNKLLDMFNNSEEGVVTRKKIRLRSYNNDSKYNLEVKITNEQGRSKYTEKLKPNAEILKKGLLDNQYGICYPQTEVEYIRQYYLVFNFRVTIDSELQYSSINKIFLKKDSRPVIEIKSIDSTFKEDCFNLFPFERSRFSKYCESIKFLKKN